KWPQTGFLKEHNTNSRLQYLTQTDSLRRLSIHHNTLYQILSTMVYLHCYSLYIYIQRSFRYSHTLQCKPFFGKSTIQLSRWVLVRPR
uniref:Uncharacterized protein n=1 Tax=Xiphophorus maculatus TaxID=8083 RepID=A0A3B5QR12_XIPMA